MVCCVDLAHHGGSWQNDGIVWAPLLSGRWGDWHKAEWGRWSCNSPGWLEASTMGMPGRHVLEKEQPVQHPPAHTGTLYCSVQPFGEEGMGAPEVPRAVPMSQGWLLPSPCTAGVSGIPPCFPKCISELWSSDTWKDVWFEGDWWNRGFRIMGVRPAVFSQLFGSRCTSEGMMSPQFPFGTAFAKSLLHIKSLHLLISSCHLL